MRGLGVPRRLVSAVEGEGLFNDATALVTYRVAVAAVVAGASRWPEAGAVGTPPAPTRCARSGWS